MLRVAVLGADGAGKSTVTARLVADLPYTVRRMYLGVGAESATHALPTTHLNRTLIQQIIVNQMPRVLITNVNGAIKDLPI